MALTFLVASNVTRVEAAPANNLTPFALSKSEPKLLGG